MIQLENVVATSVLSIQQHIMLRIQCCMMLSQYYLFNDGLVIVTKRRKVMEHILEEIIAEGKQMCLEVNAEKTKIKRIAKIKMTRKTIKRAMNLKRLAVTSILV